MSMTIKEAKNQVKEAVVKYLRKNADGEYLTPIVRQRPLFLVGAPGIGKTAIMEQVASELDIALVSYSMTHHTRQSAIGLPYLKEVEYGGKKYTKSEYTMSEIIASVYDVIEKTGKKEGILFLDEINCVSETLAPAMLQFLQYKVFGNQQVPEGWVVVTAGNPPQFNKSVKEFDVATMDRVKMVNIDASFDCWKEYAYNAGIHPAIISFLEMNPKWFYKISSTVDGKKYITARGWEDLSTEIQACEELQKEKNSDRCKGLEFKVTDDLISEYITDTECARKFAVYYDLFKKYRVDYSIADILKGTINQDTVAKAKKAAFDERLSIISMIMESVTTAAQTAMTNYVSLHDNTLPKLRLIKKGTKSVYEMLQDSIDEVKDTMEREKIANALSASKKAVLQETIKQLQKYKDTLDEENLYGADSATQMKKVKEVFKKDTASVLRGMNKVGSYINYAYEFIDKTWGDAEQEAVMFTTELTTSSNVANYIAASGNEAYKNHNGSLMTYDIDKNLKALLDSKLSGKKVNTDTDGDGDSGDTDGVPV